MILNCDNLVQNSEIKGFEDTNFLKLNIAVQVKTFDFVVRLNFRHILDITSKKVIHLVFREVEEVIHVKVLKHFLVTS